MDGIVSPGLSLRWYVQSNKLHILHFGEEGEHGNYERYEFVVEDSHLTIEPPIELETEYVSREPTSPFPP